jgi:N-acetylglucosamine-6-phosphate deacetylase
VTHLAEAAARGAGPGLAIPIGIHLEGPWLNPGAAGAQPRPGIRPYDPGEGEEVLARGEGCIRMVTLAPEAEGAAALQQALARRGITAALGHSLARCAQAEAAVDAGARHVTHLFNAMSGLHHREPGLVGVALSDERLSCDLICDGAHVDPRVVRLAARAKGEKLVLITDRIDPPGLGSGSDFGSGALVDDGVALRLPDGRLAGSRVTLDRALRNARAMAGMQRLEAVAACTLRPARVIGVEAERGSLRRGARADFALLDDADVVRETWIAGERVYSA